MGTLRQPVLEFGIRENGAIEIRSPWFPFVAFTETLLEAVDPQRLQVSGSELTITCVNGGARYLLGPPDGGVRHGRLLESW